MIEGGLETIIKVYPELLILKVGSTNPNMAAGGFLSALKGQLLHRLLHFPETILTIPLPLHFV